MFDKRFYIGVLFTACLTVVACESDEFDDAPTVSARERSEARASARSAEPSAPQQRRPASAQNLPADHPPIDGSAQQRGSAGALDGQPSGGQQAVSPEKFGEVGPLRWQAPETWRAVKPASSMRLAEYHLPPADGSEPATMTVFYFGKGGGGSIQDNIDRWVGQVEERTTEPKQTTRTVNGLDVHLVDTTGTFNSGAMMGGGQAKPDWRMRAAIVESPAGNFFFKLTGPSATVAQHDEGFESFVSSFEAATAQ